MSVKNSDISNLINSYETRGFDSLSKSLDSADNRIKFGNWLLQNFSPESASSEDFAWQSRVITLICAKAGEDGDASLEDKEKEDVNLANLISQAEPSNAQNQAINLIDLFKRQVHSEKILDIAQIHSQIKYAHLPATCTALLKKMQDYPDFSLRMVLQEAIVHKNFSMIKVLEKEMPDEFKDELESITARNRNSEKLKVIAQATPDAFKAYLAEDDGNGALRILYAVQNNELKIIELIAHHAPEAFTIQNEEGETPLLAAVQNNSLEATKVIVKAAPNTLLMQNQNGETPLVLAAKQNNLEIAQVIFKAAPNTLLMQNQNGETPLVLAAKQNNLEMIKAIFEYAPGIFETALTKQTEYSEQFLSFAVKNDNYETVKFMLKNVPGSFETALTKQRNLAENLILQASKYNDLEMIKAITKALPDIFETTCTKKTSYNQDPFCIAFKNNNLEMVKFMFEAAPEKFKLSLMRQDSVETPVVQAVKNNNLEMVKFMFENAPIQSKIALEILEGDLGMKVINNLSYQRVINTEMLKLLIKHNPEALNIFNSQGRSVLSTLKSKRPENYQEIVKLVKDNVILKEHQQTLIQRVALSHAFHISGNSTLIRTDTNKTLTTINLEGHLSPEWFHLMSKDLSEFKKSYPNLLDQNQLTLLNHLFDLGANENFYTAKDKIGRIQLGLPVIINSGYGEHAVNLLMWGDQFILCNRGGGTRRPIEVYHFNPLKVNEEILEEIAVVRQSGSKEEYQNLIFSNLSQKLEFTQNELDQQMEAAHPLPDQTIGNCTFVSPITAVYAFILMGNVRGADDQGLFLNKELENKELSGKIKEAVSSYQTWLSHLQLSFLENIIRPLEKGNTPFVPDHALIAESLRKAHLLPLDSDGEKRLDGLTTLYSSFLNEKEGTKMKSDSIYWKTLSKQPLL